MLNSVVQRAQALRSVFLPAAYYSIQVVVPSLGESITDGTIAAVFKAAGDPVKENETIAQIETDKVTVDIKAPSDGTILGVVVQEQETVTPGQLVATLDDTAAKANLIGATPAPSVSQPAPAQPTAASPPQSATTGAAAHRLPGIRFPPRVTADGRQISMLPAAEAEAILTEWRWGGATAPSAAKTSKATATTTTAAAAAPKKDVASSLFVSKPAAAAAPAAPSRFATSSRQLDRMPARRELTDKEMELIDLGGAL